MVSYLYLPDLFPSPRFQEQGVQGIASLFVTSTERDFLPVTKG
jgi:hypothetical protein